MELLKIRNWEKWQTWRNDRGQPPWIKVHRQVLRNLEWVSLSDAERGQLVSIWILAADNEGKIPNDAKLIKKLCYLSKPPNLKKFIDLGFILPNDANMTPERRQYDELEKKRKEKNKNKRFKPPCLDDVLSYAKERGYSGEIAKKAFEHYSLADWHDTYGKPVLNWKQKINTNWFKPEHKIIQTEDAWSD